MNLIISLIYTPIVFFSLRNFEIKTVSLFIFIFSILWFITTYKKGIKEYFFSLLYILISLVAYFSSDIFFLKLLPFLISLVITSYILYSYITKNSFILFFLEKTNKKVDNEEKNYIQKSTLFWFFSSIINLLIHIFILYINNNYYWMIYSSLGWYFIFIVAGLIQFLHKKFIFEKRETNV